VKTDSGIESIDNLPGPRGAAEQVVRRIREAVVSGRIAPGTWLREAQLAAHLGVSRIPVREALARLEAEGIVERVPYRGARVARFTLEQITESCMLRALLEGLAVKLATPRFLPEDLEKLKELICRLEECTRLGRTEELPPLHRAIHSLIYSRCGSKKLIRWLNELYSQFPRSLQLCYRFETQPREYQDIVRAIESGEAERAGRLMSEHIDAGSKVSIRHYAEVMRVEQG